MKQGRGGIAYSCRLMQNTKRGEHRTQKRRLNVFLVLLKYKQWSMSIVTISDILKGEGGFYAIQCTVLMLFFAPRWRLIDPLPLVQHALAHIINANLFIFCICLYKVPVFR